MLTIQIIALIVFVIGVVLIPIIDQLFFYSAFDLKGQSKFKENSTSGTPKKHSSSRVEVTRTTIERQATQEDLERFNEPDIKVIEKH